jgi:hypothetical protein
MLLIEFLASQNIVRTNSSYNLGIQFLKTPFFPLNFLFTLLNVEFTLILLNSATCPLLENIIWLFFSNFQVLHTNKIIATIFYHPD